MTYRIDHAVHDVNDITRELLDKVCDAAMGDDNTSDNFLFPNGDNWLLLCKWKTQEEFDAYAKSHDDVKPYHISYGGVSFRNYCGTLELLITDANGNHIIYNKIDGLSRKELLDEYYHEIMLVKHLTDTVKTKTFQKESDRMCKNNEERLVNCGFHVESIEVPKLCK